jgi:energy-coupling factor transporter transmembrane protein EcfT
MPSEPTHRNVPYGLAACTMSFLALAFIALFPTRSNAGVAMVLLAAATVEVRGLMWLTGFPPLLVWWRQRHTSDEAREP